MRASPCLLIISLAATGCGDDELTCGPGTTAMGGACIAGESICGTGTTFNPSTGLCEPDPAVSCAPGTIEVRGECVPDGTVICGAGTTYDMPSGRCIPDISACGEGTVEVDGVCVPFDEHLPADNDEGPEPNDATLDGALVPSFVLPDFDETTTFRGCVVPEDVDGDGSLDADFDSWLVTVGGPTLLEIRVDGFGGLSGGFLVAPTDPELIEDGFRRAGVSLTSHRAHRQLYLPKAGTYVLSFTDGRSILIGPAGGETACYYAQVTPRAMPAPTALATGETTGPSLRTPLFYEVSPTADQFLFASLVESGDATEGSLTALVGGAYYGSANVVDDFFAVLPATVPIADPTGPVLLVVDTVLDYSLDETEWSLQIRDVGAEPLPSDGTVTVTHREGPGIADRIFLSFDASAGEVVHLELSAAGVALAVRLLGPDARVKSDLCTDCTAIDTWYRADIGGTHYVAVRNLDGMDGVDYEITSKVVHVAPIDLVIGTDAPVDLASAERAFFVLDTAGVSWLAFNASLLMNLTAVDVTFYPDASGVIDEDVIATSTARARAAGGFGRIVEGEARRYLVAVEDAGAYAGTETFTFNASARTVTDLGTVSATSPIAPAVVAVPAAGERAYFIVHAADGSRLTVTATPDAAADVRIEDFDLQEVVRTTANSGGPGVAEALERSLAGEIFLAFALDLPTGDASMASLGVTAIDPP